MRSESNGGWHWRAERPGPGGLGSRSTSKAVGNDRFPSQGEAETWLGETYLDLLDAGVRAVSLYEGDRLVYGPMGLEADR